MSSLREVSKKELDIILERHIEWLADSTKGERADLRSADLRSANLSYADLRAADLRSANLSYTDLRSANLFVFKGPRHTAYFTHDGRLRIGCESLPITKWAESYREIGTAHNYSEKEIEVYGDFIRMCLGVFERESKQIVGGEE